MDQLKKLCNRDNAILVGEYSKILLGTIIHFNCKCQNLTKKSIRNIRVTGALCDECVKNKKGFYQRDPDDHEKCSVCGIEPISYKSIIEDNWETCWGRNMFFCPNHRVQYPCNNDECDADECYNFREDKNWKNIIKYWDYENEVYE